MSELARSSDTTHYAIDRLEPRYVPGCVDTHCRAYIAAYKPIDNYTHGGVTDFVEHSNFRERKLVYYSKMAAANTGAYVAWTMSDGARKVVGVSIALQDSIDPTLLYLDGIFVDPEHTARRLGTALLSTVLFDFPHWKRMYTTTTAGSKAESFFAKSQFKRTDAYVPWPQEPYQRNNIMLPQVALVLHRESLGYAT